MTDKKNKSIFQGKFTSKEKVLDKYVSYKYMGDLKNKKHPTPHGIGIATWSDGRKYEGEFKNGSFHGKGTWINPWIYGKKGKYIGEFKNGIAQGKGTWINPYDKDGKYVGKFKNNVPHGKGIWIKRGKTYLKGIWKNGIFKDYD